METIVRLARCSVEDRLPELLGGKNGAGDTALLVAARHGHGETVEVLMKLAPELAAEVNGAAVSPLYLAVMSGSVRGCGGGGGVGRQRAWCWRRIWWAAGVVGGGRWRWWWHFVFFIFGGK